MVGTLRARTRSATKKATDKFKVDHSGEQQSEKDNAVLKTGSQKSTNPTDQSVKQTNDVPSAHTLNDDVQYLFRYPGAELIPDDAIDEKKFLKRMQIDNPPHQSLFRLFVNTLAVHQQIALVLIDYLVFALHQNVQVTAQRMFGLEVNLLAAGYLLIFLMVTLLSSSHEKDAAWLKQGALCMMLLATFAPLLRTLTESYSSDTVNVLATMCGVVHLFLYDYFPERGSTGFENAASLNAGFLMSLLLASRLDSSEAVASFLLCSIVILAFVPTVFLRVQQASPILLIILANFGIFVMVQSGLRHVQNHGIAVLYCLLMIFISAVCPVLRWYLQRWKHVIRGPWDVVSVPQLDIDEL